MPEQQLTGSEAPEVQVLQQFNMSPTGNKDLPLGASAQLELRGDTLGLTCLLPQPPHKNRIRVSGCLSQAPTTFLEFKSNAEFDHGEDCRHSEAPHNDGRYFQLNRKWFRHTDSRFEFTLGRLRDEVDSPDQIVARLRVDWLLWDQEDFDKRRIQLWASRWDHILADRQHQIGVRDTFENDIKFILGAPLACAPAQSTKSQARMYVGCTSNHPTDPVVEIWVAFPWTQAGFIVTAFPTEKVRDWKWIDDPEVGEKGMTSPCEIPQWSPEDADLLDRVKQRLENNQ